jgi:cell wall-associated NlpC family hydrolase
MKLFSYTIVLIILLSSCTGAKNLVENKKENALQHKYATIIGVPPSAIKNVKLYAFIDDWYGVNYKYGGITKSGVDCSGFCHVLFNEIYHKHIKRTTADLVKAIHKVNKKKLKEGDLVFFNIAQKKNAHVGIYLMNNKFVHASSSKGVLISSLTNPYYTKAYNKGGHL